MFAIITCQKLFFLEEDISIIVAERLLCFEQTNFVVVRGNLAKKSLYSAHAVIWARALNSVRFYTTVYFPNNKLLLLLFPLQLYSVEEQFTTTRPISQLIYPQLRMINLWGIDFPLPCAVSCVLANVHLYSIACVVVKDWLAIGFFALFLLQIMVWGERKV